MRIVPMPVDRCQRSRRAVRTKCEHHCDDDFSHGGSRRCERGSFERIEFQLDDRLDTARAEPRRYAHEEVVDSVLSFEVRGTGEHALLIAHDRVGHLRGGGAWRVPGGGAATLISLCLSRSALLPHPLRETPERPSGDPNRSPIPVPRIGYARGLQPVTSWKSPDCFIW